MRFFHGQLERQLVYKVFGIRFQAPLYVRVIEPVLELFKIPKFYVQRLGFSKTLKFKISPFPILRKKGGGVSGIKDRVLVVFLAKIFSLFMIKFSC